MHSRPAGRFVASLFALCVGFVAPTAMGVTIDWVTVGNPGNVSFELEEKDSVNYSIGSGQIDLRIVRA